MKKSYIAAPRRFDTGMTDAAAVMGYINRAREHIEPQVNQAPLRDVQYPLLVPVDTTASPFTQTVTYYSSEQFGRADWINGNADDIPLVGSQRSKKSTPVHTAGIGYDFGWEELQVAMALQQPLEADGAFAARRAADEMIDRIAIYEGDPLKGFYPLIAHPAVTPGSAVTGGWGTADIDDVLGDINDALNQTFVDSGEFAMADTLLLPAAKMNRVAMLRVQGTAVTGLQFIRENNIYTLTTGNPLTIRSVPKLATAGVGNTARMAAYSRNPQVLKFHLPMPHRFLETWRAGPLRWEVPGVMRLGGTDIRRPAQVAYRDGI